MQIIVITNVMTNAVMSVMQQLETAT